MLEAANVLVTRDTCIVVLLSISIEPVLIVAQWLGHGLILLGSAALVLIVIVGIIQA